MYIFFISLNLFEIINILNTTYYLNVILDKMRAEYEILLSIGK